MWSVRILKGPNAGKIFNLREGSNVVGRSNSCAICIPTAGISKEHTNIIVQGKTVFVQDLKSTNGTFVNGVRISKIQIKKGDKLTLFDCLLDLQPTSAISALSHVSSPYTGNVALDLNSVSIPNPQASTMPHEKTSTQTAQLKKAQSIPEYLEHYMRNVVLPGIYKLGEAMEFRWALGLFIALFVVMVTFLSVIPMIQITKAGIEQESMRRTDTLAETLKDRYINAVKNGTDSTFDTRFIEREPGVDIAIVVSADNGRILAPARKAGESINRTFVHEARRSDEKIKEMIDGSHIGVSVPIESFSKETASPTVTAHAIVIYNMGSVAIDTERTLSLFIQVFTMALFLGFIIFYFMENFIDYPIHSLNSQLNKVLKNEIDSVSITYNYPKLASMVNHLNSLIHRARNPNPTSAPTSLIDRVAEARGVLDIIDLPALALDKGSLILCANTKFEELTGLHGNQIESQTIESLNDQALILSLKDLIERSASSPNGLSNQLEFSGNNYEIILKTLHGDRDVSFYLVVFKSSGGGFDVG